MKVNIWNDAKQKRTQDPRRITTSEHFISSCVKYQYNPNICLFPSDENAKRVKPPFPVVAKDLEGKSKFCLRHKTLWPLLHSTKSSRMKPTSSYLSNDPLSFRILQNIFSALFPFFPPILTMNFSLPSLQERVFIRNMKKKNRTMTALEAVTHQPTLLSINIGAPETPTQVTGHVQCHGRWIFRRSFPLFPTIRDLNRRMGYLKIASGFVFHRRGPAFCCVPMNEVKKNKKTSLVDIWFNTLCNIILQSGSFLSAQACIYILANSCHPIDGTPLNTLVLPLICSS